MKYKKIYIEITNICNLSCSFCAKNARKPKFMSIEEFTTILNKIKGYTEYIYLHVMGEPLMHPEINKLINIANQKGFKVNITTNGFLIDKLDINNKIRQINFSLHSVYEQNQVSFDQYLIKLFQKSKIFAEKGTYINFRVWRHDCDDIIKRLENEFKTIISIQDKTKTLAPNIFYSYEEEFTWPIKRLGEGNNPSSGSCRALKDHIALLVDGTVVPCCLDNEASIPLGNIFESPLSEIINAPLYNELLTGFNENKKKHKLCQNCTFYEQK